MMVRKENGEKRPGDAAKRAREDAKLTDKASKDTTEARFARAEASVQRKYAFSHSVKHGYACGTYHISVLRSLQVYCVAYKCIM